MLQSYTPNNFISWSSVTSGSPPMSKSTASKWSLEASKEIASWLKDSILLRNNVDNNINGKQRNRRSRRGSNHHGDHGTIKNFSHRQLFCRICASVAMALRFGEGS